VADCGQRGASALRRLGARSILGGGGANTAVLAVCLHVLIHLQSPARCPAARFAGKRGSGLRSGRAPASLMAMPKTAVDKQRDASRRKDESRVFRADHDDAPGTDSRVHARFFERSIRRACQTSAPGSYSGFASPRQFGPPTNPPARLAELSILKRMVSLPARTCLPQPCQPCQTRLDEGSLASRRPPDKERVEAITCVREGRNAGQVIVRRLTARQLSEPKIERQDDVALLSSLRLTIAMRRSGTFATAASV
jgi:hypothetical protein